MSLLNLQWVSYEDTNNAFVAACLRVCAEQKKLNAPIAGKNPRRHRLPRQLGEPRRDVPRLRL